MHALATMAACVEAGAQPEAVAASLARFAAPHRRFEYTGTVCGVKLYTDYGHNPAEMRSALENAAKQPHKRLFAVMQPHTYSRVKTLFQDYIHCCDLADDVLVTDIFAAREKRPRRYPRDHARGSHAEGKAFPRIIPRPSTTRRPICARALAARRSGHHHELRQHQSAQRSASKHGEEG